MSQRNCNMFWFLHFVIVPHDLNLRTCKCVRESKPQLFIYCLHPAQKHIQFRQTKCKAEKKLLISIPNILLNQLNFKLALTPQFLLLLYNWVIYDMIIYGGYY